jgi:hypothetical protein
MRLNLEIIDVCVAWKDYSSLVWSCKSTYFGAFCAFSTLDLDAHSGDAE